MGERDGEVALKGWIENRGNEKEGDLPEKLDLGGNKENLVWAEEAPFSPPKKKKDRGNSVFSPSFFFLKSVFSPSLLGVGG